MHGDDRKPFLSFAPPEPSVAAPYLQLVALSEGHIFPSPDFVKLYDQTTAAPLPTWYSGGKDWPAPPRLVDEAEEGGGDVRRALMRLQVECGWRIGGGAVKEGETEWSEGQLFEGEATAVAGVDQVTGDSRMEVEAEQGPASVEVLTRMATAADGVSFADAFVARRLPVMLLVST